MKLREMAAKFFSPRKTEFDIHWDARMADPAFVKRFAGALDRLQADFESFNALSPADIKFDTSQRAILQWFVNLVMAEVDLRAKTKWDAADSIIDQILALKPAYREQNEVDAQVLFLRNLAHSTGRKDYGRMLNVTHGVRWAGALAFSLA